MLGPKCLNGVNRLPEQILDIISCKWSELLGKDTAGEKYKKGGYKEAAFPE